MTYRAMKRVVTGLVFVLLTAFGFAQDNQEEGRFGVNWDTVTPSELRQLLSEGFEVDQRARHGMTPLMYAAQYNENPEAVEVLLDAGANVNARDVIGMSSLIYAAQYNENPEVVQVLLDAGANIEATVGVAVDMTPLIIAARYNENPEVVQLLLDAGADATAQDGTGMTAWDHVQENDSLEGTEAYWELNDRRFE